MENDQKTGTIEKVRHLEVISMIYALFHRWFLRDLGGFSWKVPVLSQFEVMSLCWRAHLRVILGFLDHKNTRNRQISMSRIGFKKIPSKIFAGAWRNRRVFFFGQKKLHLGEGMDLLFKERNRSLPLSWYFFSKKCHGTFLHTQTEFFDKIF